MQELQEMARPHLVNARVKQIRLARDVGGLLLLRPGGIGRCDVVRGRHRVVVRSGNVDVREVAPVVGRRLGNERLLGTRNGDDLLLEDVGLQLGELFACGRNSTPRRFVSLHFQSAGAERSLRQVLCTSFLQRLQIARQVRLAERRQLCNRRVHPLRRLQHVGEHRLPERERARRVLALGHEPLLEVVHRLRRGGVGVRKLLLRGRILDRGEHLRHIVAEEVRKSAESGDASLENGLRHRRMQVGANIRRDLRNRTCVAEVTLQSGRERRVVATQIDLWIEPIDVPGGVRERELRTVEPEQVGVRDAEHILALEPLARGQRPSVESRSLCPNGPQPLALFREPRSAEVRHLAIEFMPPGLHGKKRMRLEVVLDELCGEGVPGCLRLILRCTDRCGHRSRRRMTAAGRRGGGQDDEQRSDCEGLIGHSALPKVLIRLYQHR